MKRQAWRERNPVGLRYAVKNGVYRFKQRVDLHNIAAKIVLAIDSPIFAAYAVGYKRSGYIGSTPT